MSSLDNNNSTINKTTNITKESKRKKIVSKELTEDEIKEFLKNSILIPKEKWEELPINSYISYYKEDDKFIKGGYVKLIFTKNDNLYMIYGTKLDKYNNDKYYKEFTINLNNIKSIYKQIDKNAIIEYQIIKNNITKLITDFNTKLDTIVIAIDKYEKKIIKLEENHYKTIKLIKSLHNIKTLDNLKNE